MNALPLSVHEAQNIISQLGPQLTENRRQRIQQVVENRTRDIALVLEGIYDQGNISAVVRTAESLGFLPLHIIETQTRFKAANRVSHRAEKWLEVTKWKQSLDCITELKKNNYRVFATRLEGGKPIGTFDFSGKTALIFGNERQGVSEEAAALCDDIVYIPMHGFSQSFNISVACAISLYHIQQDRLQRRREEPATHQGTLTPEEQTILTAAYYRISRSLD